MNPVIDLMRAHVSVREYTGEEIPADVLDAMIEAGRAAATWRSLQSYSIIRTTPEQRAAIFALLGQQFIADCAEFLVFVGDMHRADIVMESRDVPLNTTGVEPLLISAVDAALAAQNINLAAESLGFGGVFCGYLRSFSVEVAEMLGLPQHTYPLMGLALGRPVNPEQPPKPRLPRDLVVFEGTYGEIDPAFIAEADAEYAAYPYDMRPGSWSDRFPDMFGPHQQPRTRDYLRTRGFDI
jgi:nitroreductase